LFEFTNHLVCAAEEQDLFIEAQPPLLETERNELASTAVIDFEIACLRQSPDPAVREVLPFKTGRTRTMEVL